MVNMVNQELVERVVQEVMNSLRAAPRPEAKPEVELEARLPQVEAGPEAQRPPDLANGGGRREPPAEDPENPEALSRMMRTTPARIGVGKAGPRLRTKTLLTLRADHAMAQDSVFMEVDPGLLEQLGLFTLHTMCADRNQHLTRPDLGRQFSPEALEMLKAKCKARPTVQIFLSDGLSSRAVEANAADILPTLTLGLQQYGIGTGTPFFVKFGRVPLMDVVSEALESEVTCVLIGERPGLATAESMSAYIAYRALVGMPESRRTVVSNIHGGGVPAVEAGAYIADVIREILKRKVSGVDFKL